MKISFSLLILASVTLLLSGCAATYRPIHPPTVNYSSHDLQDGIAISYKYDVLQEKGNKKYAKKENQHYVKLVSMKITNHTDSTLNLSRDVLFYCGDRQFTPMEPEVIKQELKQIVPGYLPYLLLSFVTLDVYSESGVKRYPIGLVLGPIITMGNMATAGGSNNKMKEELDEYNLINQDIRPGETVYGLIGIRDSGYDPIRLLLR